MWFEVTIKDPEDDYYDYEYGLSKLFLSYNLFASWEKSTQEKEQQDSNNSYHVKQNTFPPEFSIEDFTVFYF